MTEVERKQDMLKAEFRRIKGVEANLTDVRPSAMEDFLGRGDLRLASVIRRAWERGAGMDSWWESLDRAFAAWSDAIECVRLTSSNSQIQNKRTTKGFILIRHKRYQIYTCLQLSSSIASFVRKPAHFELQSCGGA